MDNLQFFTILASIFSSLAWMIFRMDRIESRLNDIDKRLTVVETILQMMGYPVKPKEKSEI